MTMQAKLNQRQIKAILRDFTQWSNGFKLRAIRTREDVDLARRHNSHFDALFVGRGFGRETDPGNDAIWKAIQSIRRAA